MSAATLSRYLNLRTLGLLVFYGLVAAVSYFVAYELRFDFNVPDAFAMERADTIWWVVMLKLMLLAAFGQVDCILSYFRLPDVLRLFVGLFLSALILLSMWYVYYGDGVPPRAVILSDLLLCFLALTGFRILARIYASRELADWFGDHQAENVIIVGAGEVGATMCSELMDKARLGMRPVAFLDDNLQKVGRYIHGVLVADAVAELPKVAKRYSADKVVIAFPSASMKRVQEVVKLAQSVGLNVDIVPALTDIVSGRARMTELRPVQLEDLLGRDPVDLNSIGIREMLEGKRVLVTGAGGSIGRELVVQILEYDPAVLACVDQAEIAIFNLQHEVLIPSGSECQWKTAVLDVLDTDSMEKLFAGVQPEVVFHAAAHKHVNLMEAQPAEALRNNFLATRQLAGLASRSAVERFVFISTDKAINPTSVMGVSKRLAELALQEQQTAAGNETQFMAVRFGNVLGSSGSVIPIFRRQINHGGPITVTDPEVTRFFMTVQEAVGLVLQSATQGKGGEIFVLDMGESMKILDVARQMIGLSGLREGIDIEIEFTGLRPGEKLYEEVQHLSETLQKTGHDRVLRFVADAEDYPSTATVLEALEPLMEAGDARAIKSAIAGYVTEYSPHLAG
ncbi:MAG: polysaccharide biosynthesis protein [Coraliomargarita sp.]